ncbi:MAG TPA: ISNCY family transposase [Methanobacterium sp.]
MGKIDFEKILKQRFTNTETPRNVDKNLNLLEDGHFEYVNQVCQYCGSKNVIKQEYRERHPIMAEFGQQTIYQRRYKCKSCGRKFTVSLDTVIKPRHRYASMCRDKSKLLIQTGARSLRKMAEDFYTFYGYLPSHQTIQNWLQNSVKKRIQNEISYYSGYYVYDEQYIKIKGKRHYRLTLYDFIQNIPVAEEIVLKLTEKAIYNFIKDSTHNNGFYSLTTDHMKKYKTIADDFGVIHQQCIFHLYKMIGKPIYKILKDKTVSKQDKIRLTLYFTEIKNIFRTFNEKTAIQRLETLLEKFTDIPQVLQRFITKKIIPDFQRLTQFMRHLYISRTSNPNENYFRQTDPEQIKRKYKTTKGFTNYTNLKMQYWTRKHGKILNPQ